MSERQKGQDTLGKPANRMKGAKKADPIHWDLVAERIGDLVVDRDDLMATRRLMLKNVRVQHSYNRHRVFCMGSV